VTKVGAQNVRGNVTRRTVKVVRRQVERPAIVRAIGPAGHRVECVPWEDER